MGALIGALRVSLSAETAAFEAGMKRAQRTTATATGGIAKSLGRVKGLVAGFTGALALGGLTAAIKSSLEYASHLTELGETLGLTAKDLQTFSFAAGTSERHPEADNQHGQGSGWVAGPSQSVQRHRDQHR
jgi:hypothetical protein